MAVEGLGRAFNLGLTSGVVGSGTRFNLKNYAGVTFVLAAGSGTTTVQEANAASGGTQRDLPKITRYYTQSGGVWTKVTQAAAATITTAGLTAVYVDGTWLSDGYTYVTIGGTGITAVAILHDVEVQRAPANLANVSA